MSGVDSVVVADVVAGRVVFGAGAVAQLGSEVARLGITRAFVIASRRQQALVAPLGEVVVGVHHDVTMHVPEALADSTTATARALDANGLVAIGGGSAVGLAKAIALQTGWPIVAVPTTFAGSEMTSIWGITSAAGKRTGRDASVRPRTVIADPRLVRGVPRAGDSGLNAIAHAVEALYATGVDPITTLLAQESIRLLARHLPLLVEDHLDDWAGALRGAWFAGVCLDRASMGLHHKLCHTLGGSFGLDHAGTHAVVLPYVVAFNSVAVPAAVEQIRAALGVTNAVDGLRQLGHTLGVPRSLAALGLRVEDLDHAARQATAAAYQNPRPASFAQVRALLAAALSGEPPVTD